MANPYALCAVLVATCVLGVAAPSQATVISGTSVAIGATSTLTSSDGSVSAALSPTDVLVNTSPAPYKNSTGASSGSAGSTVTFGALTASDQSDVDGLAGTRTTLTAASVGAVTISIPRLFSLTFNSLTSFAGVSGDFGALGTLAQTSISGLAINGAAVTVTSAANQVVFNNGGLTVTVNAQSATGDKSSSANLSVNGIDVGFKNVTYGNTVLNGDVIFASSTAAESATPNPVAVPEPAGMALLGLGLAAAAVARRRT